MNWAHYEIRHFSIQNTSIYIAPALQLSAVKNGQSLKLPDACGPTILDHTKQHCRNKQSMITPEAWTPVIINRTYGFHINVSWNGYQCLFSITGWLDFIFEGWHGSIIWTRHGTTPYQTALEPRLPWRGGPHHVLRGDKTWRSAATHIR